MKNKISLSFGRPGTLSNQLRSAALVSLCSGLGPGSVHGCRHVHGQSTPVHDPIQMKIGGNARTFGYDDEALGCRLVLGALSAF